MRKTILLTMLCAVAITISGCIHPYQIPVQQGKIITPKLITKLKPGMTEDQVKYILGSPDIIDPYHPDTWYYVYTIEQNYLPRAKNQLIIYFKNDKLDSLSGDYPPPSTLQYPVST